mmetsp:Transcript_15727/g.39423  ORF Transcript_15727/g.39423 Transcript_15727/m.39423 type:complete len:223 (+) Transcript_15727:336-1004(+)
MPQNALIPGKAVSERKYQRLGGGDRDAAMVDSVEEPRRGDHISRWRQAEARALVERPRGCQRKAPPPRARGAGVDDFHARRAAQAVGEHLPRAPQRARRGEAPWRGRGDASYERGKQRPIGGRNGARVLQARVDAPVRNDDKALKDGVRAGADRNARTTHREGGRLGGGDTEVRAHARGNLVPEGERPAAARPTCEGDAIGDEPKRWRGDHKACREALRGAA